MMHNWRLLIFTCIAIMVAISACSQQLFVQSPSPAKKSFDSLEGYEKTERLIELPDNYSKALYNLPKINVELLAQGFEKNDKIIDDTTWKTRRALSYSSVKSAIHYTKSLPKEVVIWEIDYCSPDKFLVSQAGLYDDLSVFYDKWVSIGVENYQDSGLWARTEDSRHEKLNQSFTPISYIELLENNLPVSYGTFSYVGESFLLLIYQSPFSFKNESLYNDKIVNAFTNDKKNTLKIYVWVNVNRKELVRVDIDFWENAVLSATVRHTFGCYNANIKVKPPEWLNLKTVSPGKYVIINGRLPPELKHYDCQMNQ